MESMIPTPTGGMSTAEILMIVNVALAALNSILAGFNWKANFCGKPCSCKLSKNTINSEPPSPATIDPPPPPPDASKLV